MTEPRQVNTIRKAVCVLETFTAQQPLQSGAAIAQKTGIPVTTTRRLVNALTRHGLLERDARTGEYGIGPSMYRLGSLYMLRADIFAASRPVLASLAELTRETISVGTWSGRNVVIIMKEEPATGSFRLATNDVGTLAPAYAAAMGKAFLAQLTDPEIDAIYPEESLAPLTRWTVSSKAALRVQLATIRRTGLAVNSQETHEGVESIASLIWDRSGASTAAIAIAMPVFRLDDGVRQRLSDMIRFSASLVSRRLGYGGGDSSIGSIEELASWWNRNSS